MTLQGRLSYGVLCPGDKITFLSQTRYKEVIANGDYIEDIEESMMNINLDFGTVVSIDSHSKTKDACVELGFTFVAIVKLQCHDFFDVKGWVLSG